MEYTVRSNIAFSVETKFTLPYSLVCVCVGMCLVSTGAGDTKFVTKRRQQMELLLWQRTHNHTHTHTNAFAGVIMRIKYASTKTGNLLGLKCVYRHTHIKNNLHQGLCKHAHILMHSVYTHRHHVSFAGKLRHTHTQIISQLTT